MSPLADESIAALRMNHEELAASVRRFGEPDLARQSGSSEWNVAQVLSHLGSGAEIMLATVQAGIAHSEPPAQDLNQAVWDRWNAMGPRHQAEDFLRTNEELVATLESIDAADRSELRFDLAFLPFPADLALISGMRLFETALHGWDVNVAFDPDAALPAQEAALTIEHLTGPLGFLIGFLGKPAALDTGATVRVETTNPSRVLSLTIGDAVGLNDAPTATGDVLTGTAEAFVRLLAGRLHPAPAPNALSLTSDTITLGELRKVFPGI